MSPTWPLEMLATTTFEDIDNKTKVTITWQPWNSDDIGNSTFDSARDGMTQGFNGTFSNLEAYLKPFKYRGSVGGYRKLNKLFSFSLLFIHALLCNLDR